MINNYPKICIRPIMDGRLGGAPESLKATTMNVAKLFFDELRYPDGTAMECGIADTCIGRVREAAACEAKFESENEGVPATHMDHITNNTATRSI